MVGTTALIIMGIAQAGSAIAKAKIEANAAKKAAEAQTAALNTSTGINNRVAAQAQQNLNPYMQGGGQAMTTLTSLMAPQGTPGAYNPAKPPQFTMNPYAPGLSPGGLGPGTPGSLAVPPGVIRQPPPMSAPPTPQPMIPPTVGPGGVTPRMASGQPLNPYQMRA